MNKVSLTAREFVELLLDDGSFVEVDKYVRRSNAVYGYTDVSEPGEGVISGWGKVMGMPVCVFAEDESVLGGSLGEAHAAKIIKAIDMAKKSGYPVVARWCSNGARVQEGAAAVDAYVKVVRALNDVSGVVPTISVCAGEMYGIAASFAAITDFTIAVEGVSAASIHPPMVLASKDGIEPNAQKLVGAKVMVQENGLAALLAKDEAGAVELAKKLLGYLPANNLESADLEDSVDDINRPTYADAADVRALIADFADAGSFMEIGEGYAPDMVTAFVMLDGISCGVVANAAGKELNCKGFKKAARFISILDAFDMPIITLVNNEGTVIKAECAQHCQTPSYAKLITSYALAGSAKVSLITGNAIGEGFAAMGASACHDVVYAYPTAKVGCMNEKAGSIVMYGAPGSEQQYAEGFLTPMAACGQGVIDDIIEPVNTRAALVSAVSLALSKREEKPVRKHIVMPL